jgi:hypothetical protein
VEPPVATSILLSTSSLTFASLLDTETVAATVLDQNGRTMTGVPVTWTTSSLTVALAQPGGLVTAVGNGVATITAAAGSVPASALVTVLQVPVAVAVSPEPVAVARPLATATARASVLDARGFAVPGAVVMWWSSDESVALVNADGVITGVMPGTTTVTAEAALAAGGSLTDWVTVNVGNAPLITTAALATGMVGDAYDQTLTASGGGGVYTWALTAGTLPEGLSLGPDGSITGTPTVSGFRQFTVEVTSAGETDARHLAVAVEPSLRLATSYLVGGYPGMSYGDQIAPATGGDGTYGYAISDGTLPSGLSLNAATGAITGTTSDMGMWFFEITAQSGMEQASAVYAITISTNPPGAFNLWGSTVSDDIPDAAVREQLSAALARWEAIVTSELDDYTFGDVDARACAGAGDLLDGALVDDVVALVDFHIGQPGGLLGFAGSCVHAGAAPFTMVGYLSLDAQDLTLMSDASLFALMWHELGHIMGIGLHWEALELQDLSSGRPVFTGAAANGEYDALLGSQAQIPIEDGGGPGTALGHWDEEHFDNEIMTGFMDPLTPISRMTIASLADIGWSVSYDAADPYTLPACSSTFTCVRAPAQTAPGLGTTAYEVRPPFEPVVIPVER